MTAGRHIAATPPAPDAGTTLASPICVFVIKALRVVVVGGLVIGAAVTGVLVLAHMFIDQVTR
ncbi:hypothetical protein ABJI51_16700 [Amycolatopsis sp. NEAU-NG30]|uniref:Uncharacterized protein n=1 Tax=Amycolatopsis melonis TaxID=3156488 RepID=A0ABV0LEK7_9PSEU